MKVPNATGREEKGAVLLPSTRTFKHHNGKQTVCRAPRAHGKGTKTHGKDFAVRFSSGRTAKGAR
jgi:hypothetical protein